MFRAKYVLVENINIEILWEVDRITVGQII